MEALAACSRDKAQEREPTPAQMLVSVDARARAVIVTTKEELEAAAKEKREPICIGFPLSDIVKKKKTHY
jgi:hypothetical protein